ncbi:DEAD/DEAH box helicase [Allorhodopirellula solitaria]|uniref:RNA polymerase-associated protein RapA n=1 Tax=Allorhodopirellula solitaria TaxID=2527987 RepID=A0A5C5XU84_9BACT|nr:DEAD/DEAH box helicase [Allorhodopirellula solitaria]TWT65953.1 RNA polymerase-associated protein RapA [Allorhodopirellula solitaria]
MATQSVAKKRTKTAAGGGRGTADSAGNTSGNAKRSKAKVNRFHQRLGTLTYSQACKLLLDEGAKLIQRGGQAFEIQSDRDVFLGGDLFRVRVEDADTDNGVAIASLTLSSDRKKQLAVNCDCCDTPCVHVGAALEYLLDAKSVLGLAMPPDESVPLEHLTPAELRHRMLADREKRASEEKMTVRSINSEKPWTDYVVTSSGSGRTYRVALRSLDGDDSYCTCPDFRTNRLGTCKHVVHVRSKISKRFSAAKLRAPYRRKRLSLGLRYGDFEGDRATGLQFYLPHESTKAGGDEKLSELVGEFTERSTTDAVAVMAHVQALETAGYDVTIFPDAEAYLQRKLTQQRLKQRCDEIRQDAENHPLRTELLDAQLLPYQLDGIAFAVGAGRAILADDMGLGKTIQGIGIAELLSRLADIRRVLVVCPASLKAQWRAEITKFSDRSTQIVIGNGEERCEQYQSDAFFTICNYEQVLRDLSAIENAPWDLIILDEGQRIKNYESKTSNVIRQLQSPFRLVLSGTPLENRLGELFTVARFVDDDLLGPAYRFFHNHHVVDERGKTLAYRNLDTLRETMSPILLRRTRTEVARQLPERTDQVVRCEATAEQLEIHDNAVRIVAQIAGKKFMTEMDRLRMQKCLLLARMACDSTYLCDQEAAEYSSKLERITEVMAELIADPSRKIVLFSEWRRMLSRIESRMDEMGCEYVRLDGNVPQKKRAEIVARFQNDPECRVICMTNAGSTGLNLQSANTVVNVDLPWNPAVLEQRIARAYRMGQKQPVHIYKFVTTHAACPTIEEGLLTTLAAKQDLADASINIDSDVNEVAMQSGMEDLKRRLEVILPPKLAAPVDESQQRRVEAEAERLAGEKRREQVAQAGGQLLSAALSLAGGLVGNTAAEPDQAKVDALTSKLSESIERDEQGRPQLKISLPSDDALRDLASTLARLLG